MVSKRIDFISFEEFQKLYKSEKDKEMKLFILLAFGSGLRISEIIGFKRKTKMKKGVIYKDDSLQEIPPLTKDKIDIQKHQIKIDDAKGGKWRITVIPPLLEESMLNLLPITIKRRTVNNRLASLSRKILGKKISPHTLRHGFGNYQVNVLNVPLPIVQQMMGHSRLDTTGIYTKANPEFAIQAAWKAMGGD
jgi:integrase